MCLYVFRGAGCARHVPYLSYFLCTHFLYTQPYDIVATQALEVYTLQRFMCSTLNRLD